MKAFGIPVQASAWKPASTLFTNGSKDFDKAPPTPPVENTSQMATQPQHTSPSPIVVSVSSSKVDLDECHHHLSTKQLEDLMEDDDCHGPVVSNGDPMLSSPHLLSSPSSHYSRANVDNDALSPEAADSMDLAAWHMPNNQVKQYFL